MEEVEELVRQLVLMRPHQAVVQLEVDVFGRKIQDGVRNNKHKLVGIQLILTVRQIVMQVRSALGISQAGAILRMDLAQVLEAGAEVLEDLVNAGSMMEI